MAVTSFKTNIRWFYDQTDESKMSTGIWLHSNNMDVSGGSITKEEIDELSKYPLKSNIRISGLNQETFEYFIEKYGQELRTVYFFKNKTVEDWSLLGTLPNIIHISWFHNQKIDKLWDMSKNNKLKGIILNDFTRLKSLNGIDKAENLERFSMGDAVWNTTVVDSYLPFAYSSVKYLDFHGKAIRDEDLSFLEKTKNLKEFNFAPNMFSTEKIIWAVANFPNIKGESLVHFYEDRIRNKETGDYDIPALCMVGKGKRKFKAEDLKKKKRLEGEICEMEERYKGIPYSKAFGKNT